MQQKSKCKLHEYRRLSLGITLGLAAGNIVISPALGMAIGTSIGAALEKKYEKELRLLTKEKLELKRKTLIVLIGLLIFGAVTFFILLNTSKQI